MHRHAYTLSGGQIHKTSFQVIPQPAILRPRNTQTNGSQCYSDYTVVKKSKENHCSQSVHRMYLILIMWPKLR